VRILRWDDLTSSRRRPSASPGLKPAWASTDSSVASRGFEALPGQVRAGVERDHVSRPPTTSHGCSRSCSVVM
jgi:hypothetical protein